MSEVKVNGIPVMMTFDIPEIVEDVLKFGSWDDEPTILLRNEDGERYLVTPRQFRKLQSEGRIVTGEPEADGTGQ